jgi:hypothetical protein
MASRPRKSKTPPTKADRGVPVSAYTPPPWQCTEGCYLAGKEALDEADHLGEEMERYWGRGRLRLLVNKELAERFDRQRYLTAQARWEGQLEDVKREAGRMVKAYRALDSAAKAVGASPVDDETWEATIPHGVMEGTVLVIVKNEEAIPKVTKTVDGRNVVVMTLKDIAHHISMDHDLLQIRQSFPGAAVEARSRIIDPMQPSLRKTEDGVIDVSVPIDGIQGFPDWEYGDEVPF